LLDGGDDQVSALVDSVVQVPAHLHRDGYVAES
jgi:hypothetical protein